jgi:long-subunit acyl-CoA synthetase (AMP-forming)
VDDLTAAGPDDFDFVLMAGSATDDVATLITASGTTGNPKGVEMTTPTCCSRRSR